MICHNSDLSCIEKLSLLFAPPINNHLERKGISLGKCALLVMELKRLAKVVKAVEGANKETFTN
jgi:hypothetical protein